MSNSKKTIAVLVLATMLALAACGNGETEISAASPGPADETEQSDTETPEPSDGETVEPSDEEDDETAEPSDDETTEPSDEEGDEPMDPVSSEPPPVELSRGDNTVSLTAWSYCWTAPESEAGLCADGAPPENPETLAGDGPITLSFPADFTFAATVYDADYANEVATATVVADGDGWRIDPATEGPAVLQIFGNGPEGDVSVSVAIG